MITWIITILALIGSILNIKKRRECFILWILTNLYWIIHDFRIGEQAQGVLFMTYSIFSIWGFIEWSKGPKVSRP